MQKVLDYREQLEEEAKVRLATAERPSSGRAETPDGLRAELGRTEDRLRDNPLMEAAERWLQEQYITGLRADVTAASLQTRMLAQMAEEAANCSPPAPLTKNCLKSLKNGKKSTMSAKNNCRSNASMTKQRPSATKLRLSRLFRWLAVLCFIKLSILGMLMLDRRCPHGSAGTRPTTAPGPRKPRRTRPLFRAAAWKTRPWLMGLFH